MQRSCGRNELDQFKEQQGGSVAASEWERWDGDMADFGGCYGEAGFYSKYT